jgi:hypothetical protein
VRTLGRRGGFGSARRLVKPGVFLAVVFLLLFFSKITVAYQAVPTGLVPLPDNAKDKVTVVSIGGMLQMIRSYDPEEEDFPTAVTVKTWNLTNGQAFLQPLTSDSIGCENVYSNSLIVNVETANELTQTEKATVNVTVFESASGRWIATQLLVLQLEPGVHSYTAAKFTVMTDEPDPIFLVKVTFPTQAELNAPLPTTQLPLFEYVLVKLGIMAL